MALSRNEAAVVDREVRDLLARSLAFHRRPPREREQLVDRTTRIASRLAAHEIGAPVAQAPRTRSAPRVSDDPYALALDDPGPLAPGMPGAPPAPGDGSPTAPDDNCRPHQRFRPQGIPPGL